jgi:hypothetical protein
MLKILASKPAQQIPYFNSTHTLGMHIQPQLDPINGDKKKKPNRHQHQSKAKADASATPS